jgi:gamma-glutamyltranspeptidase/glutathione hydrolase
MEERFPVETRRALIDLGHEVEVLDPWSAALGGAQALAADAQQGVFQGGADPRRDGFAFGL